jgi:hypothetical protein
LVWDVERERMVEFVMEMKSPMSVCLLVALLWWRRQRCFQMAWMAHLWKIERSWKEVDLGEYSGEDKKPEMMEATFSGGGSPDGFFQVLCIQRHSSCE